jgi:hypothetical protein
VLISHRRGGKILHVRHPSYLFSLVYVASSTRTRNFTVPPHRTLAMSQSFVQFWAVGSLLHDVEELHTHRRFVSAMSKMYPQCLICFIAFVSIFYLIIFIFLLGFGFWTWHIDTVGAF